MSKREYWLGFSVFHGIGPITFQKIYQHFGSAKDAWEAPTPELRKSGLGEVVAKEFDEFRKSFSPAAYSKKLQEKNISFFVLSDNNYPKNLKQIKNPPFVLYIRGDARVLNQTEKDTHIGIVGTRMITNYGREVTEMVTQELVKAGMVIVSGLAMGVDAIAHKTALEAGGKTIAVLGSGIDVCYPSSNQHIYNSIIAGSGAVVSEYPLGEPPSKGSFPSRNRIIAGLSEAIVVTEGAEDSGALITADDAFKYKRKVFAVPGPITSSLSKGPFKLLQKGATLVTRGQDIRDGLGIETKGQSDRVRKKIKGETKEEQKIIDLLQNESLQFDEIVKKTGFSSSELGILLSLMEVKGVVKSIESSKFGLA